MFRKLNALLRQWQVSEYFYLKLAIYAATSVAAIIAMVMAISQATSQ